MLYFLFFREEFNFCNNFICIIYGFFLVVGVINCCGYGDYCGCESGLIFDCECFVSCFSVG